MSHKDDLPEIPSWEELGLTPEEVEELEREARGEPPAKPPDGAVAGPEAPPSPAQPGKLRWPWRRRPAADADRAAARPGGAAATAPGAAAGPAAGAGAAMGAAPGAARPGSSPPAPGRAGSPPPPAPARSGPPPPRAGLLAWLAPLALVAAAWLASSARIPPRAEEANAPATAFSAARARAHLERIARRAHPPGSPEHAEVRAYLLDELEDLGFTPSVQTTTSLIGRGSRASAATVRNIVARVPGSSPGDAILVTAHYDGRGVATAAGDDGVGVAAILEALRALRAGSPIRNDVIVLFTDAEELGLLGARAFVDEHAWLDDVALVLSFEMRGAAGPALMFETGADNGWVVAAFRDAVARPGANSLAYEIYQRMPNDTDFTPFREAGKQGLNFAAIGDAHVYHQAYDTPARVSGGTLQHHGDQALALLRHLGDADLLAVNAPDVSYVSVPFLGLLVYGSVWAWLVGIAAAAAWGLAVWRTRRKGGSVVGLGAGLLAGLATLGVAAGAAYGLFVWRRTAHPEFGALHGGAFHEEGWYVLAIATIAVAAATLLFWLALRRYSAAEVNTGAMLVPVAAAAAATVAVPLGAASLQWAALAGGLVALSSAPGAPGRLDTARWLVALGGAAVALAFLLPLAELLWLAMTLHAAHLLGAVFGVIAILLVPALEPARVARWWVLPAVLVAAAGAFAGIGTLGAAPSAERPAPSTMLYALDRADGSAVWATDGTRSLADPGVTWARGRVDGFGEARPLSGFALGDRPYRLAPAPVAEIPPIAVTATLDSTAAGAAVRVSVRSAIGGEALAFALAGEGPELRAVNGEPLPNAERVLYADHWGAPEGAVELLFARGFRDDTLAFDVIEHMLRPAELVGAEPFRRPPDLAPDITRLSDRALIRTPVRIDLATGVVTVAGAAVPAAAALPDTAVTAAAPPDTAATVDAPPDTAATVDAPPDTAAAGDTAPPEPPPGGPTDVTDGAFPPRPSPLR